MIPSLSMLIVIFKDQSLNNNLLLNIGLLFESQEWLLYAGMTVDPINTTDEKILNVALLKLFLMNKKLIGKKVTRVFACNLHLYAVVAT
jgi:hypothetical protein